VNASRSNRQDIENQIALGVRQLYIGLVISDLDLQTASLAVDVAQQKFAEAKDSVAKGAALEVTQIGAHASLLDAQQKQLEAKIRHSDFSTDLVNVLGLSPSVRLKAAGLPTELPEIPSKEECISSPNQRARRFRPRRKPSGKREPVSLRQRQTISRMFQ
jgi:outer membrane protein TolC